MAMPGDINVDMPTVPAVLHLGQSAGPFVGLFDVRFHKINALRMAPLAYVAVIAVSAFGCLVLDIVAFRWSTAAGWITTLLLTPALFLTLVILIRFVLEFMLSLLVLPSHLALMTHSVQSILGTTTTIVGTTTDISSDTSGLGIIQPMRRLKWGKRERLVPIIPIVKDAGPEDSD